MTIGSRNGFIKELPALAEPMTLNTRVGHCTFCASAMACAVEINVQISSLQIPLGKIIEQAIDIIHAYFFLA